MATNWVKELKIPEVGDRHYWFVRTSGGAHYDDFIMHNYIAIGWDYVSISSYLNKDEDVIKRLIETNLQSIQPGGDEQEDVIAVGDAKNKTAIKKAVSLIYNKIGRFIIDMHDGDIVLIPSRNSDEISIGVLSGPVYEDNTYVQKYYEENPLTELHLCPFYKRRKISWLKHISKTSLDIFLARAIGAQHSVSCIDDFSELINRSIYNIYATDSNVHAVIHAGHPNGLSFAELRNFINSMDDGMSMMAHALETEYRPDEMDVKITIHSPGILEICALIATGGLVLSALIYALNHYRHGGKSKLGFSIKIGGQELTFNAEDESRGSLGFKESEKQLELEKLEKLIALQEKLGIEYPEIDEPVDSMFLPGQSENGMD